MVYRASFLLVRRRIKKERKKNLESNPGRNCNGPMEKGHEEGGGDGGGGGNKSDGHAVGHGER